MSETDPWTNPRNEYESVGDKRDVLEESHVALENEFVGNFTSPEDQNIDPLFEVQFVPDQPRVQNQSHQSKYQPISPLSNPMIASSTSVRQSNKEEKLPASTSTQPMNTFPIQHTIRRSKNYVIVKNGGKYNATPLYFLCAGILIAIFFSSLGAAVLHLFAWLKYKDSDFEQTRKYAHYCYVFVLVDVGIFLLFVLLLPLIICLFPLVVVLVIFTPLLLILCVVGIPIVGLVAVGGIVYCLCLCCYACQEICYPDSG